MLNFHPFPSVLDPHRTKALESSLIILKSFRGEQFLDLDIARGLVRQSLSFGLFSFNADKPRLNPRARFGSNPFGL
jgi:hypothetical protein